MHELTVAVQIRRVLESELVGDGDLVAERVRVQVGALTGIVPEALEFAWPHAVADSPLLGSATLEIEWIEASLACRSCSATHRTANLRSLRCPVCHSPDIDVTGGDELDIADVDVRERSPGSP
jgi:hydrogenase nickel incorporation protein HypA/HybF